jgi:putative ABC transport system substrate-binding protein
MRRREFIVGLGSAAVWPVVVRAQQAGKVARIGFLGTPSASEYAKVLAEFKAGLRELGYVDGANMIIDYRWGERNYARLAGLATELVLSNVDVIVTGGTPASLAAKQATTTIPIVMADVGDAVAYGLVASLARPGGNITGQSFFAPELGVKRIALLKEILPLMTSVAYLFNPDNPSTASNLRALEAAARFLRVELQQFPVRAPNEFESAFERMEQGRLEGVEVADEPMLLGNVGAIAELATTRRLPSVGAKELAQAGGLIGYGVNFFAIYRRAAVFVDKVLKGTKPADLPVEQPSRFGFALNLKTAKALGLTIPETLLATADQVIE